MSTIPTKKKELDQHEVAHVNGASAIPIPFPLPPGHVTPPKYVTQAIGEDGGEPPLEILR